MEIYQEGCGGGGEGEKRLEGDGMDEATELKVRIWGLVSVFEGDKDVKVNGERGENSNVQRCE